MTSDARKRLQQSATARQHAASAPGTSAVALASAGSGKTQVLIGSAKRLLLNGAKPDGLICLTFTKAAAAQMANRLRRDLAAWASDDDATLREKLTDTGAPTDDATRAKARTLFPRALEAPGGVKIQTVHAFCQSLLARFPIEAGVRPGFQALDDRGAAAGIGAAFREAVVDPRLADAVGLLAAAGETKLRDAVDAYLRERDKLRRFAADREETGRRLAQALGLGWPIEAVPPAIDAACVDAAVPVADLRRLCAALVRGSAKDAERAAAIGFWLDAPP
ncbi:MAG: UvrD-helicase domain-containing protein, partial [Pseudomonadota bacterium]